MAVSKEKLINILNLVVLLLLKRPLGKLADHSNTLCLVASLFISTIDDFGTVLTTFSHLLLLTGYNNYHNYKKLTRHVPFKGTTTSSIKSMSICQLG